MSFIAQIIVSLSFTAVANAKVNDLVDCSAAYYESTRKVQCQVTTCSAEFQTFLGSWEGPFVVNDPGTGSERDYRNQVTYSEDDCLKNIDSSHPGRGDEFIIGRQTDIFPKIVVNGKTLEDKIEFGLLITGKTADGTRFLRTINPRDKRSDYTLVKRDEATVTSIWSLFAPNAYCKDGQCFDLKFTTFDGQDMSYKGKKRDVRISMEVFKPGTQEKVFESQLASGYHILQK